MTTPVKFEFDSNSAPMEKAWQKGAALVEQLIREIAAITPAADKADQAALELLRTNELLGKQAAKLRASLITPQQEYADKLKQADTLLEKQLITQDEYTAAVTAAKKALEDQDGTTRTAAEATAKLQAAEKALESQAARLKAVLVTPQEEYAAKVQQADEFLAKQLITQEEYTRALIAADKALKDQDGTTRLAAEATAKLNARQAELDRQASRLKSSLVTPQQEYADAVASADELLKSQKITEEEYAAAVARAKEELDGKDAQLQKVIANAKRIRAEGVTPEQQHAAAIESAKQALARKLITQKEYDAELRRQHELLEKSTSGTQRLGNTGSSVLGQFGSALSGFGATAGLLGVSLTILKKEYEEMIEKQKTAAQKQLDVAGAQRGALFALGDDKMSPEQLDKELNALSVRNKVGMKALYDAAGNALSSRGALESKDAIEAVDIATQIAPLEGATELAGSILDMRNRYKATAEQIAGLNLGTQQASRVKDQASFARNVVPTIVQLGGFGDSAEQSSRLVAALSTAMNDLEGRQSATAAEQLAKQLAVALPAAKTGLQNTTERIQYLQTDAGKRDREKLFGDGKGKKGTLSFESGAYVAMNEIVASGNNQTKKAYDAAVAAIPTLDKADEYYRAALARVNSQRLQIQSEVSRAGEIAAEQGQLHDTKGASSAMARKTMEDALKASGSWWSTRWVNSRFMDYNEIVGLEDPKDFAARQLKQRADNMSAGYTSEGVYYAPTAEQMKVADALREQAATLMRLNTTLDRTIGALDENTKSTKENSSKQATPKKTAANQPAKPRPSSVLSSGK